MMRFLLVSGLFAVTMALTGSSAPAQGKLSFILGSPRT